MLVLAMQFSKGAAGVMPEVDVRALELRELRVGTDRSPEGVTRAPTPTQVGDGARALPQNGIEDSGFSSGSDERPRSAIVWHLRGRVASASTGSS